MYIVRYYLTGGTFTSKLFDTLSKALRFSVYQVRTGDTHSIDLIK